jgi:hypothetical protein
LETVGGDRFRDKEASRPRLEVATVLTLLWSVWSDAECRGPAWEEAAYGSDWRKSKLTSSGEVAGYVDDLSDMAVTGQAVATASLFQLLAATEQGL